MATDIRTKTQRRDLAPRREPYWARIRDGCYLGYRALASGAGTWIARYRNSEGGQLYRSLGSILDGKVSAFDQAARLAAEWFDSIDAGVSPAVTTVQQACEAYVSNIGDEKKKAETQSRLRRLVYGDAIAKIELSKLKARDVKAWRKRLEATEALVGRSKTRRNATRERSDATINRDMTC
ncbi:MAG TPA: hypothetical protein VMG60_19245, partial [Burkholderiaceae bacterium]|nr:hypothetical protein [Burkholderiaceae bacterium]